jgi:general secretion pathway protein G
MIRKTNNRGFTLIEMMVVVIIIGLLATIALPNLQKMLISSKARITTAALSSVATSLKMYMFDCGNFPMTEPGLQALKEKPTPTPANWNGPYTENELVDAWGNPLQYRCPAQDSQRDFDLWSFGIDGKNGTDDDIIHMKKNP